MNRNWKKRNWEQLAKNIAFDLGTELEVRGNNVFLFNLFLISPSNPKKFWFEVWRKMHEIDPKPFDQRLKEHMPRRK